MGQYWVVLGGEVQGFWVFTSCWGQILERRMRCDLKTMICSGCYNDITWHQFTTQLHLTPSPNSIHISRQGGPNFIATNLIDIFYIYTHHDRPYFLSIPATYFSISAHAIFQFFSPFHQNSFPTQTLPFLTQSPPPIFKPSWFSLWKYALLLLLYPLMNPFCNNWTSSSKIG